MRISVGVAFGTFNSVIATFDGEVTNLVSAEDDEALGPVTR